jgi:hypothetical protein
LRDEADEGEDRAGDAHGDHADPEEARAIADHVLARIAMRTGIAGRGSRRGRLAVHALLVTRSKVPLRLPEER